jgi:hypothetical protein
LSRARPGNVDLLTDGVFWYTRGQADAPPVRDRSAETGATLKAANISMLEIKAAFKIARDDNAGGDDDDLVRTVARLLGFKRVGPDLQARIAEGYEYIRHQGRDICVYVQMNGQGRHGPTIRVNRLRTDGDFDRTIFIGLCMHCRT